MVARKSPPIAPPTIKRAMEVESLCRWAFREELPKRQTSSAEGIWRDMEISGPYGQIDNGSAMQRYDFGMPHRDAELIERAVVALPLVVIDWDESLDAIMGDLAGLVAISDVKAPRTEGRATSAGWTTGRGKDTLRRVLDGPRDVIMVGSVQTSALVQSHASQGTRPSWYPQRPKCYQTPSRDPSRPMLVGECRGKDLYSTGSHNPLSWYIKIDRMLNNRFITPLMIAQARADYIGWWRGLSMLAESLELHDHVALPPAAERLPWFDAERAAWLFGHPKPPKLPTLPLKPGRPMAGRTRGQAEDVAKRTPGRIVEQ